MAGHAVVHELPSLTFLSPLGPLLHYLTVITGATHSRWTNRLPWHHPVRTGSRIDLPTSVSVSVPLSLSLSLLSV